MTHEINQIFFDTFKRLTNTSYQPRIVCEYSTLSGDLCGADSFFDSLGIDDVTPARKKR